MGVDAGREGAVVHGCEVGWVVVEHCGCVLGRVLWGRGRGGG